MSLPIPIRNPLLCYVTDGQTGPHSSRESLQALLQRIAIAANDGVDWIQIREKHLPGGPLAELAHKAMQLVPQECRILLNDRVDVAIAVAAGGVHLGEKSISVADARRLIGAHRGSGNLLVGASTHSLEAALANEKQGADYLVFGPVFETPSKAGYGPAQGLQQLEKVCRSISVPVLAIGGITQENARQCLDHGAAGIAAIRMFQNADLRDGIRNLRQL